jgi:transcriptional regulator with XRE-family HTH domain
MNMKDDAREKEKYGEVFCTLGDIMEARNLSVSEVAVMCKTLQINVQRAVDNTVWPSAKLLARLCCVLNVEVSDLIGYRL